MSRECDEFDQLCNVFGIERYDLSPSHSPTRTADEPYDTYDETDNSDDCTEENRRINDSILRISSTPSKNEHSSFDLHEYEVIEAFYGSEAKSCCKKKCNEIIPRELTCHCRDQFREFSKHEQDLIVLAHLNSHRQDISLESYYNSLTRKKKYGSRLCSKTRADTVYMFHGIPICRTMYLFIFDIGIDRYKNLVSHFDKKKLQPRVHGLTNKTPKCKSGYTPEIRESVVQFIKNYADHHAIPLPGRLPQFKNFKVMKLPSDTKISVYRRYIEACSDKKEKLVGERCFYYLWNECCPFIQTMKSADDLCDTCKENSNIISEAKNSDDREERLNIALSHLRTAKDQRAFYTKCITDNTDSAMVISFDYAQNVAYPASSQSTGAAYFKSARKSSIFGILNEKSKIQTNFLVDESCSVGKGPNSVISMLHYYFERNPADHIIAFADNCVSQNKNNALLQYLSWRVRSNLNKTISLNFLITAHTKFGPDRMFGLIKMKYSRSNVDCFDDLVRCVDESSIKGLNVSVRANDIDWRDWDNFLKDSYCSLPGITKFHHFTFDQEDKITCKKYVDTEEEVFFLRISEIPQDATPDEIKPLGLSIERQWYLFNEIRSLCSDPKKADKLAPKPMISQPKKEKIAVSKDIEKPVIPKETNATMNEQHDIPTCSSELKKTNETKCTKRTIPTCSSESFIMLSQAHSNPKNIIKKLKKN